MAKSNIVINGYRGYDPKNFTLRNYCEVMDDLGINFLHQPVDQVLHNLECRAFIMERIPQPSHLPIKRSGDKMECMTYCINTPLPAELPVSGSDIAHYKHLRYAHFIGKCYVYALDDKVRQFVTENRVYPRWKPHIRGHYTAQKLTIISLWTRMLTELDDLNYRFKGIRRDGSKKTQVEMLRTELKDLLDKFEALKP